MKLLHVKHSDCQNKTLCFGSVRRLQQNFRVWQGKLASFDVTLKTVSEKMKKNRIASNKCTSVVRTLFIGHVRATSFSSARTDSKTQQNIELMTFALTWCANIFVGCSVTPPFFFGRSLPFLTLFIILKNKKNLCVGSFNYFSYSIKKGSNGYMDTGVRDLEDVFF